MTHELRHVLVIGRTDAGRRACALLQQGGTRVTHLDEPTDAALHEVVSGGVDGVAVLLHDDIKVLRYVLVVHHMQPELRIFATMFDRTARAQVQRTVQDCVVLSPAAASVPQLIAAVLGVDDLGRASVHRITTSAWHTLRVHGEGVEITEFTLDRKVAMHGRIGRLLGQLRPYDAGTGVLIGGVVGLLVVTGIDAVLGLLHEGLLQALYNATRTTATISSPPMPDDPRILAWASLAALLVMAFTAMFAAGLVNYLLSGRHVSLIGRRVVPQRGHVIIVGMGQVGLRLAQHLQELGVAVLGIDQDSKARTLEIARTSGIPVLIGDGASRKVLQRARVQHCLAVVAAGSQDRDNIAVAVSALAVNEQARVVLRAGMDEAIEETRSLFHIGPVVDVNGLTASLVAESLSGNRPYAVLESAGSRLICDERGTVISRGSAFQARCSC